MLKSWRPYFIIFVLGFLLYSQTLVFNFTYLDDNTLILDNYPLISQAKNIGRLFTDDAFFSNSNFYYRPLLNLSLMGDAHWGGQELFFYHLTNILLHCLAACLLFLFLSALTIRRPLAFGLSLFFLVAPVATMAVAWIPGRNDSLLTIFILAAFLVFLRFLESPKLRFYLAYLAFFFLALLSKETAVFLPFLLIIYWSLLARGRLLARDKFLFIFGSLGILGVWFFLRAFALENTAWALGPALKQIIIDSPALLLALGKMVLPINLSVYPIAADSSWLYGLFILILIIIALVFSRRRRSAYLIFGAAWFLIFFLPSLLSLNPPGDFLEHRLYLPFAGLLIILGEIDWLKGLDFKKRAVKAGAVLVIIVFALVTWRYSLNFKDGLTFWRQATASSPHSLLAQRNLGVMDYFHNDFSGASSHYRQALALNPTEPMAHNNLGVIALEEKNFSVAETEFKQELLVNPDYATTYFNLGDLYYQEHHLEEAAAYWRQTLILNPDYAPAYERLLIFQNQLR